MRIAVIGAGAMGSIYGGHLSLHNDVYLIDTNQAIIDQISKNGLTIQEMAEAVSRSPKSVDNAVQRIRRKAARHLQAGDLSKG